MVAAKNAKRVMRKLREKDKDGHPVLTSKLTLGQRASDALTGAVGSWWFIGSLFVFMAAWMAMNVWYLYFGIWDPYPFLSCLAAIQAPIILMSQNRQMERDRVRAEWDYTINRKAESEIATVLKDVKALKRRLRVR